MQKGAHYRQACMTNIRRCQSFLACTNLVQVVVFTTIVGCGAGRGFAARAGICHAGLHHRGACCGEPDFWSKIRICDNFLWLKTTLTPSLQAWRCRMPAAPVVVPAASRRRSRRWPSRQASLVFISMAICAAVFSAGPNGQDVVAACSRLPKCAARIASRRCAG